MIDKFEERAWPWQTEAPCQDRSHIVVERDTHKAMVIGDKGERIKRIGTETRVELEKLMDAKVFIEMWVKVRSGWADDEARAQFRLRVDLAMGAEPDSDKFAWLLGRERYQRLYLQFWLMTTAAYVVILLLLQF